MDSGMALRTAPPEVPEKAALPRTSKSTFWYTCPNRVVKVPCSVSVSTRVPEMNVTPSTTASAVSASLSLWASSPL